MIILIEKLFKEKEYKLDTFYLAVNIADNYLAKLACNSTKAPCLELLAVTCILLGAKIEEHATPDSRKLLKVLKCTHSVNFTVK